MDALIATLPAVLILGIIGYVISRRNARLVQELEEKGQEGETQSRDNK